MAAHPGVGILRPELAGERGVTGPMLRCPGGNYDIRKVDATHLQPLQLPRAVGDHGDVYDRHDSYAGCAE